MLTSKSLVVRSCSTAQEASRSRPFTFMDPSLSVGEGIEVDGVAVAGLCWRFCLSFLETFCLCFFGLKVSRSRILLVLGLFFLDLYWRQFLGTWWVSIFKGNKKYSKSTLFLVGSVCSLDFWVGLVIYCYLYRKGLCLAWSELNTWLGLYSG